MGTDDWIEQRVYINSKLDEFGETLKLLDSRSNKILTEVAVIKVKMGMIASGVAIVVSLASNFILKIIVGDL